MILAVAGIIIFLVFALIAIRVGSRKEGSTATEAEPPLIHNSGIYSIVRKSPRETIGEVKPSRDEIIKYLRTQNVTITDEDVNIAADQFLASLENSIVEIESGDKEGVEFYSYHFTGDDPMCDPYHLKNQFISRAQIFKYPKLIPPFHLGCACALKRYHGSENLRQTTVMGMVPLIKGGVVPHLPDWTLWSR